MTARADAVPSLHGEVDQAHVAYASSTMSSRYRSKSGANALLSNALAAYDTLAMDLNQVRVLIVPVGDISEKEFGRYRDLIAKFKAIDLSEVTPAMATSSATGLHQGNSNSSSGMTLSLSLFFFSL